MQGAQLEEAKIGFLGDLKPFDAAVLCSGSEIFQFPECAHLPLEPVKGQTLLCHWDTPLESGLAGLGHITPTENPELCQIGSTYERGFLDLAPTPEAAYKLIEMVGAFYPPAKEFRVISQVAGIRMTLRGGYRPLTAQIAPRVWAFTGLGSRGLLYHAVLGHRLALRLKDLCK
jgi:glycine/D-amino acid oxidase-like deaminating enzyme